VAEVGAVALVVFLGDQAAVGVIGIGVHDETWIRKSSGLIINMPCTSGLSCNVITININKIH
jgi:hypothetical protein